MRTTRRRISTSTLGRPGRDVAYVHLRAINSRVPPENRVRRDDRRDVGKDSPSEALTDARETPTFVVIQPQPAALQLHLQDTVLFLQKFDDIALIPLKPAKQRRDNQVQRKHPRGLRQIVVDAVSDSTSGTF
jgi:hypothetical protein